MQGEREGPDFNVEHMVGPEAAFNEASLPLAKVARRGLGKVRVAQGDHELVGHAEEGDGSRLTSPHVRAFGVKLVAPFRSACGSRAQSNV